MKILVCGSRTYINPHLFHYLTEFHSKFPITHLLEGGGRGADRQSMAWAITNKVKFSEYPANWELYGKAAGPLRNQQMINQKPAIVIAFFENPSHPSPGISDCLSRAKLAAIPILFGHEEIPTSLTNRKIP